MITIRPAALTDIAIISKLANEVWPVAYKDILQPAQLTYMLDKFYSYPSLKKQIEEDHHQFILAIEDNAPVGFASYGLKQNFPDVYKLHKLYVSSNQQGKGTGKKLLHHIITAIRSMHARSLELNVNRQNKARLFYEKEGFSIIGEEDIAIGGGYFMNDYVMEKIV